MEGKLVQQLEPNQIVDGRYRLVRIIGSGTFGTVWCAEHLTLSSSVALKLLDRQTVAGEMQQRFLREARAAAALRSPHVVQILDCGIDGDTPYIAMELLEGESLQDRLDRTARLGVVETERLLRHVARAIHRAHEAGIIHRDLKPGNIFIQANDGEEIVKVLDFGIAKTSNVAMNRSLAGVTPAGVLLGTPNYMSPEQVRGDQDLDCRADIWSMGVIAYECLLGKVPFDGENITAVLTAIFMGDRPVPSEHGEVPPGFDAWFARACATAPADRYATAKLAAEEFARCTGLEDFRSSLALYAPHVRLGATAAKSANETEVTSGAAPVDRRPSPSAKPIGLPPRRRVWAATFALLGLSSLLGISALRGSSGDAPSSALEVVRAEARPAPASAGPAPAAAILPLRSGSVPDPEQQSPPASVEDLDAGHAVKPNGSSQPPDEKSPRPRPSVVPGSTRSKAAVGRNRSAQPPARKPRVNALKSECEPPWYFDDRGQPRAKPNCL